MLQAAFRFCGALLPHSLNFPRADLYDTHVQACFFCFIRFFCSIQKFFRASPRKSAPVLPLERPVKIQIRKAVSSCFR